MKAWQRPSSCFVALGAIHAQQSNDEMTSQARFATSSHVSTTSDALRDGETDSYRYRRLSNEGVKGREGNTAGTHIEAHTEYRLESTRAVIDQKERDTSDLASIAVGEGMAKMARIRSDRQRRRSLERRSRRRKKKRRRKRRWSGWV